jgi:hypothetical protein
MVVTADSDGSDLVTVTSGHPSIVRNLPVGCGPETRDLAVDPAGGKGVVATCGGPSDLDEYDLTGRLIRTYRDAAYGASAVAFSPVGSGFAGVEGGVYAVWEYKNTAHGTVLREELGRGLAPPRSAGYSADGTVLFVLLNFGSGPLVLHTFPGTAGTPTTDIDVTAPTTQVPYAAAFPVTGVVRFADGTPAAGVTVTVANVFDIENSHTVTTGPDGSFTTDAASGYDGEQRYLVTYDGDARHNAAAKEFTVTVAAPPPPPDDGA